MVVDGGPCSRVMEKCLAPMRFKQMERDIVGMEPFCFFFSSPIHPPYFSFLLRLAPYRPI